MVANREPGAITSTVSTPHQIGQFSPDGRWRWDGTQWVPSGRPGFRPPRRGSLRWQWWVAGGCALLLVGSVSLTVLGVALFHGVQSGLTSCLPHDFPAYTSAHVKNNNDLAGTWLPEGDSHECRQTLDTRDDVATVDRFYASHLDSGDWKVVDNFAADGHIDFRRISRPLTVGTIQILGGFGSRIFIELFS
jgi:hypothetical protein